MNLNLILRIFPRSLHQNFFILHRIAIKSGLGVKNLSLCTCSSRKLVNLTSKSSLFSTEYDSKSRGIIRKYSSENNPPSNKLPALMEFPKITWPSLLQSIKNFILANLIIKPYLDNDFSLSEFVVGSKKAVEVVSKKISEGDTKSLNGLVSSEVVPILQRAVSLMSLAQREQFAINVDDIYFSFPYQVGVMFNEENDQKRFVEVTMVFHALKGLSGMRLRGEEPPMNMGMMPEYQNKICICNYRFIREFTKGVESDWTINLLNHFKPMDDE